MSIRLTALGHEVIGIDGNREKTEIFKDTIFQTISLDCTSELALQTLPLKECDYAIVTIGEDYGASIMTTALLKQAGVRKLVSRAINPLHYKVLETLGVDQILQPEFDSASSFADSILFKGVTTSFDVTEDYKVIEVLLPTRYNGLLLSEVDFLKRYSLLVMTIIRYDESKSIFGHTEKKKISLGLPSGDIKLLKGDYLLLFGRIGDIDNLLHTSED
ncbi:MAG: TrkA family potassium uptake protein [Bacteroidales bacterium]|nr:TrkA family potassium uptake protein [Bacteroidales bacterium]